ncbi:hypothetical protein ACB092_06G189900 [Castanea dentata]
MAPTGGGRTRQVGLRRIDAALDALLPMGFAEDLVRSTVSELLEAYGGDEGWAFIEEASYKLVIDTILPESEESKREDTQPKLVGNFSTKDFTLDEPGVQCHSPDVHSMQIHSLHNHSPAPKDIMNRSLKDDASQEKLSVQIRSQFLDSPPLVDIRPVTDDTLQDKPGVQMNYSQIVNHSLKDDASQEKLSAQIQSQFVDSPPLVDIRPVRDDTLQDELGVQMNYSHISPVVADSASMNPRPLAGSCFVGRRRPCYGWISSDDDEDFVYLTPAI